MLNKVDDITVYGLGIAVPHSFHSFGSLALRMKFCSCFALAWSGVDGGVANVMPPRINYLNVPLRNTPPVKPNEKL